MFNFYGEINGDIVAVGDNELAIGSDSSGHCQRDSSGSTLGFGSGSHSRCSAGSFARLHTADNFVGLRIPEISIGCCSRTAAAGTASGTSYR